MIRMLLHRLQIKLERPRVLNGMAPHVHCIVEIALDLRFCNCDELIRVGIEELLLFVLMQTSIGNWVGVGHRDSKFRWQQLSHFPSHRCEEVTFAGGRRTQN